MTDQEINVAIAECCGWQELRIYEDCVRGYPPTFDPDKECDEVDFDAPSYCSDRNTTPEMLEQLKGAERVAFFSDLIKPEALMLEDFKYDTLWKIISADQQKVAIAFLKAKGRWRE